MLVHNPLSKGKRFVDDGVKQREHRTVSSQSVEKTQTSCMMGWLGGVPG